MKKINKVLLISLLSTFALTGCDNPVGKWFEEKGAFISDLFKGSSDKDTDTNSESTDTGSSDVTTTDSTSTSSTDTTVPEVVKVTGVTLNYQNANLSVGETLTLQATVLPNNADNKNVTWSTSDETVASVAGGTVRALKSGNATITVTTVDGNYSAACVVTVTEAAPEKVTVVVNNLSSDLVTVSSSASSVVPGTSVNITVKSKNEGYSVSKVYVTNSQSNSIDFDFTNDVVTVSVPEDGIINIEAEVEGKAIKGYVHDEKGLITSVEHSLNDTVTYPTLISQSGSSYYEFVYGATVTMTLEDKDDYVVTGLNVDGTDYKINDKGVVSFKVELDDFSDFFLDIRPTYKDNTPLTGDYVFEINGTSHLSATCYAADKTTKIVGTNRDDVVYVKVESDSEDFSVKKVEIATTSSDIGTLNKITASYDSASDMYYFRTPYAHDNVVRVNLYELNNTLLKGTNVSGTYLTVGISLASTTFTSFDDRYFTINDGGEMSLGSKNSNGTSRTDIVTEVREGGVLYTESYNSPVYGENLIFASEDGSAGIRTPFTSYDFLAVKKQSDSDLDGIYTVAGERMVIDTKAYIAIRVYRNDVEYATAFIDYAKKDVYFNPKVTMLNGNEITDAQAVYSIGDFVIGYNGTGTYKGRCIMGELYGLYTNDKDTLFVSGEYKATYNDEEFDYTYENSVVTLTKDARTVVIRVDLEARTFTVESDEVDEGITLPEFAGKRYRANFCFEDDNAYYGFYLEFSATTMTLSCVGASDYNLDMEHCSTKQFAYNENVTYTFDASTKKVTANLVVKGGSTKAVVFTYTGTSFKVSSSVLGGGSFYGTTATLTEIK